MCFFVLRVIYSSSILLMKVWCKKLRYNFSMLASEGDPDSSQSTGVSGWLEVIFLEHRWYDRGKLRSRKGRVKLQPWELPFNPGNCPSTLGTTVNKQSILIFLKGSLLLTFIIGCEPVFRQDPTLNYIFGGYV